MSTNVMPRQVHRWCSMLFTVSTLFVVFMGLTRDEPAEWVFFVPLAPLAVLFFTGLYLFVLPYLVRWRRRPARSEKLRVE